MLFYGHLLCEQTCFTNTLSKAPSLVCLSPVFLKNRGQCVKLFSVIVVVLRDFRCRIYTMPVRKCDTHAALCRHTPCMATRLCTAHIAGHAARISCDARWCMVMSTITYRTDAKLSRQGVLPQAVHLVRQGDTTRLGRFCVSPNLLLA